MECMAPPKVMLCGIEEVQIFLLANPDKKHVLTKVQLISYALTKLFNTGLYDKAI